MNLSGSMTPPLSLPRRAAGIIAGIAAIILMFLGGYNLQWQAGQVWSVPYTGLNFLAAGSMVFIAAILLLKPRVQFFTLSDREAESIPVRWRYVIAGIVAIALISEANSRLILKEFQMSQHLQALLFVAGAWLLAYGLGGFAGIRWRGMVSGSMLILWLIVLAGFLLRCWNLAEDVHIMIDELHFYEGVMQLWREPNIPLLQHVDGIAAFPQFFCYVERWTVELFGTDFAGIRFASVLFGTLTIPATYWLGRAINDHKTGLVAAALLAVFPPHIHFSRLAMNNIADPLFGTLALGFLVSALRYNRTRDYVLAGIFLGCTSYFYEGGRLLYLGLFGVWAILMLLVYRPRHHTRGLLKMALAAVIMLAPYYAYALSQNTDMTPRLTAQGRLHWFFQHLEEGVPLSDVVNEHYIDALEPAMFHTIYSPDSSQFYYGGYTGILLWYIVPVYFLGLWFVLLRAPSSGMLLWLWIAVGILGISLVVETDWTVRFCVLFPAMMLVVAIGLRYTAAMLVPRLAHGRANVVFLALAVIAIGAAELNYYYRVHLPALNLSIRRGIHDFYDAWDRASQIPNISQIIYITGDPMFTPVLDSTRVFRSQYLTYQVWKRSEKRLVNRLALLPHDKTYAFAVVPGDTSTLTILRKYFDVRPGKWSIYDSIPRERQYMLYIYQHPSSNWGG